MQKKEFEIFTKGALYDLIIWAELYLRKVLPKDNIVLIRFDDVLATGWDDCVKYLVDNVYEGEDKIKPCVDLVVDRYNDSTVFINAWVSNHRHAEFSINWQNRAGPYIRSIKSELLNDAGMEFPAEWKVE